MGIKNDEQQQNYKQVEVNERVCGILHLNIWLKEGKFQVNSFEPIVQCTMCMISEPKIQTHIQLRID